MSGEISPAATNAPTEGTAVRFKEQTAADQLAAQPETTLANKMAEYGITRVPVDYFHYGPFRYTNLKDAIAQATRTVQR